MDKITVIVPCYNEQEVLPLFYQEIEKVRSGMPGVDFEYLFVNDGSSDRTLPMLRELSKQDGRVKYVSFSRNFGKEAAMYAGMDRATGDYIVIVDADLQDPLDLIPIMYREIVSGRCDCVAARRVTREGEAKIRSWFARMFYKLINRISKTEIVDGARDYRMMTRQMVTSILSMQERNRFSKGIFSWVGFDTKWLEYKNIQRAAGETKWSFWKLFLYSIDGIVAFSTVPLAVSSVMGVLFCLLSFIGIIVVIIRELIWHMSSYGWASMICVLLLVSGVQLLCIGVLGQYLSKTYLESKQRPIYIMKETNTDTEPDNKTK